jgi:hypothetical protein
MYIDTTPFFKLRDSHGSTNIVFVTKVEFLIWLPKSVGESNLKIVLADKLFLHYNNVKVIYSKIDFSQTVNELKKNTHFKMFIGKPELIKTII